MEKTFEGASCIFKKSFFDSHFTPKSLIKVLDFKKHDFFKKRHSKNGLTHVEHIPRGILEINMRDFFLEKDQRDSIIFKLKLIRVSGMF